MLGSHRMGTAGLPGGRLALSVGLMAALSGTRTDLAASRASRRANAAALGVPGHEVGGVLRL